MMNSTRRGEEAWSARSNVWPECGRDVCPAITRWQSAALLSLLLLLVTGCQTNRDPAGGNTGDLTYLRTAPEEWDRIFNSSDATKLAAFYADDAVLMPENAPTLRGRKAIEADFEKYFVQYTARHETFVDEILTHQDWAIERGRFTLIFTPKPSGPQLKQSGRQVICRRKVNGAWLIAWEIWNTDGTAPKP